MSSAVRVFPCSQCGASLRFAPGTGRLTCEACGTVNDAPVADAAAVAAAHEELDYLAHLRGQAGTEPAIVRQLVDCPQCGAQTTFDPDVVAAQCAFCATPLVAASAHAERQIRPRGVVPFSVEAATARDTVLTWIRGRWFAPNALKHTVQSVQGVRGVYLPCWTFDARTTTRYTGQRGVNRLVQDVQRDAQGNLRTVTRTVIDWYPAAGVVALPFDDVLVPGSESVPRHLAGVLDGWDIARLVPYTDDYVAGFTVEAYRTGLEPAFDAARGRMADGIRQAIRRDIGGDHQQILGADTHYDAVTFKHLLLPVWICSYLFAGRSWAVVVNGQTGLVAGDRPWSAWKIAGAVLLAVAVAATVWAVTSGAR